MFPPLTADTPPPPPPKPPAVVRAAEDDEGWRAIAATTRAIASPFVDGYAPLARAAWGQVEKAKDAVESFVERINPPLSDEEMNAAKYMHAMLAPDKLGGADGRLAHDDVKAIGAGITDRGITGMVARRVVPDQMTEGLTEAGVKPVAGAPDDATKRRVSVKQLRSFERAQQILSKRGEALEAKLGVRVVFEDGLSRAALEHLMENKFGLPPGAKLVPVEK